MRYAILFLLFNCLFSLPANAEFETRRLFASGAWEVLLVKDSEDNTVWCRAETTNRSRQRFSVSAYGDRSAMVMIYDPGWALSKRPVSFIIDVDYKRWTIRGTALERSVSVFLKQDGEAFEFLKDLAGGSAVALYNSDERRLAVFSLSGSRDALAALLNCWAKIDQKDPFGTSDDPF